MARRTIKLPDVGEGIAQAEIVEWHVAEGDRVVEDQILTAIMTDKATVEIPSPISGIVVARGPDIGTVVAVGSTLVTIETDDDIPLAAQQPQAPATAEAKLPSTAPAPAAPVAQADKRAGAPQPTTAAIPAHSDKPLASPSVRGRAHELDIDLRQVSGSGPSGRIMHEDIESFTERLRPTGAPRRSGVETIKISGLRRVIAGKMADSKRRVAHFSYVEEVDVTALEELRAVLNARHGQDRSKLTILPFLARAIVVALDDHPEMNAHFDDEAEVITRHAAVHIGIAAQTDAGLMVPVLRHAEALDLWGCAGEIRRLADAARAGTGKREELSGSTITITSLGDLGGIMTTPVINRPEVAIVGVNRIAIRPSWQDGRFVPRKMMNLSSSFDHRVIDGQNAALFIRRLKGLLESPATMFVQ